MGLRRRRGCLDCFEKKKESERVCFIFVMTNFQIQITTVD